MSLHSNIVHRYFKNKLDDAKILVKVNPVHLTGIEMIVRKNGKLETRQMEFDSEIWDDLLSDGFVEVSAMEFNLHISGLIK